MGSKISRQTIVYGLSAVLIFAILFVCSFRTFSEEKSIEQPKIVAFGDSVFGLIRDDTSVSSLLGSQLGVEVFNAGFGGSCMSKTVGTNKLGYSMDVVSMVGLTKAILADDFGVQRGSRWRESSTEYFPEVIETLESIDFTQVETVLIQHGLNDYHAGAPIENEEDPYDVYTYLGALRSSVEGLRRVNPELRIVLVTPNYTWYERTGVTCEEADYGGGLLEDYVNAQIRVAQELNVEIVDVYHGLFADTSWDGKEVYTWDGLHPNELGRALMAERIADALR